MVNQATWNSLEVAKLVVGALTPVFVAAVGFWLNRRLKALEQAQWAHQKVVERRIHAYDQLAKPLNDLFCFFCYVGSWKEMNPPDVVKLKRQLDQTAHISAPLFDEEFLERYNALIDKCFDVFRGWGDDAQLRTLTYRRVEAAGEDWQADWNACFVGQHKATEPSDVKAAYAELMAYLGRAMGAVDVDEHLLGSGRVPGNYDRTTVGLVSGTAPDEEVRAAPNAR
jgi:hypothetical protein